MKPIRVSVCLEILLGALFAALSPVWGADWTQQLSPPVYSVIQDIDVKVPMRDGVKLSTDLYMPSDSRRFPTILVRTPYNNNGEGMVRQAMYYATRGYAVALQDVRGRYDSEGEWVPMRNEAKDGYETVEWIAQQRWSNGKVGMIGHSYPAISAQLAAVMTPPHLVCIVAEAAYSDSYKQWDFTGGAFALAAVETWAAVQMPTRTLQSNYVNLNTPGVQPRALGPFPESYWHLPIMTNAEATGRHFEIWKEWLSHPAYDDYWKASSLESAYANFAVPTYLFGGWFDTFVVGATTNFTGIRKYGQTPAARTGTQLVIGPWVHDFHEGKSSVTGDVDFGPHSLFPIEERELCWFDYWMKGIPNGTDREAAVKIFVMGENEWRNENEWPLARTRYTRYYLHSGSKANGVWGDGTLNTTPPSSEPPDTYTYDPHNPVPTLSGHACCDEKWTAVPDGPRDNRAVETRADVLVYSTSPLTEDIEVTGPIVAKLFASTSARDTDWTVKLVDVYPQPGQPAYNVADGILRARYHLSLEKPELLEPGQPYEFTVELLNTSNLFKKGHSIRIEISSSNFPQYDRNPNTGHTLYVDDELAVAHQTIYHDTERASYILLPIIPSARGTSAHQ
jgi:putative CocE/NonD family hydrolase